MKKTSKSKKLLSFFLAVVMLVTSCSVGFTAFAADGDNGLWNDSTESKETYEALNDLLDTYFPALVNAIGADTLKGIGVDVTKVSKADDPVKEFIAELSPYLIGLLGGSKGSPSTVLGSSYTPIDDVYYSYLNDSNATMSFWALYNFCTTNQSNSYAKETLPKLDELLAVYQSAKDSYQKSINDAVKKISSLYGLDSDHKTIRYDITDFDQLSCLYDEGDATILCSVDSIPNAVSKEGKKFSEYSNEIDGVDMTPFIEYVQSLARKVNAIGKTDTLTLPQAAYYYFNSMLTNTDIDMYLLTAQKDSSFNYVGYIALDPEADDYEPNLNFTFKNGEYYLDYLKQQYTYQNTLDYYNAIIASIKDEEPSFPFDSFTIDTDAQREQFEDVYLEFLQNATCTSFSVDNQYTDSYFTASSNLLVESGYFGNYDAVVTDRNTYNLTSDDLVTLQEFAQTSMTDSKKTLLTLISESNLNPVLKAYLASNAIPVATLQNIFMYNKNSSGEKVNWKAVKPSNYCSDIQKILNESPLYYAPYEFSKVFRNGTSGYYSLTNDFIESFQYNEAIKPQIIASGKTYEWDNYKPSNDVAIDIVNSIINGYVTTYLASDSKLVIAGMELPLGQIINDALKGLLENQDIDADLLQAQLTDIYKNLANEPIETIFNLLPTLVTLIDELVVPILFNTEGDAYAGDDNLGGFYHTLFNETTGLDKVTQEYGSYVGVGQLKEDLNRLVPNLLHWLTGDYNKDTLTYDNGAAVVTIPTYDGTSKSNQRTLTVTSKVNDKGETEYEINLTSAEVKGYTSITDADGNAITFEAIDDEKDPNYPGLYKYNGSSNKVLSTLLKDNAGLTLNLNMTYDSTCPKLTNIYLVDIALKYANISTLKIKDATEETNTIVREIVSEIANYFKKAVDTYMAQGHGSDVKYVNANKKTTTKGLNNIFVALPQIINIAGQMFMSKYSITSDWSYDYKINEKKNQAIAANNGLSYNESLQGFKDLTTDTSSSKPVKVLDSFVDIFVNDWVNALIDFFNDATSTNNKLTNEIPIISGLLKSLGGLGEKSVLSDILNGVFQLNYNDKASFVMGVNDEESGYVGLSTKSAYFLISNVGPLVQIISNMDTKVANIVTSDYSTTATGQSSLQPVWGNVPATSSKSGTTFISRLDAALSGLLQNSTINNFNMNSTTGLASGVISLLSFYFGSDNSKDLVKLLNSYLYQLNGQDKKSTDTSDKAIYTEANLTNLVVQTYALLENILDYYLTEQDSAKINVFYDSDKKVYSTNGEGRYVYNILTSALKGLISPHAVSTHISNESVADKLANLDSWHSALNVSSSANGKTGDTNITLNWGFSSGDTTNFFKSMGQSLGIVTDLLGVIGKDAGIYEGLIYPLIKDIDAATPANLGVTAPSAITDGVSVLLAIINPVSKMLDDFYTQPASALCYLLKGVSTFIKNDMNTGLHVLAAAICNEVQGISAILGKDISNLSPTLSANDNWFNLILGLIKNTNTQATIKNLLYGNFTFGEKELMNIINNAVKAYVELPTNMFSKIASCKDAQAVLDYLVDLVLNVITSEKLINALKLLINNSTVSQLLDMIGKLTPDQLSAIVDAVLAKTQDPTEVYWTFLQYVQKKTTGFYYPAGITASDANDAVGQLDDAVDAVFALLNGLGVVKTTNLTGTVEGLLYKNSTLTKLATALYGALEGDVATYLGYAGMDVTTSGVAALLTDSSYGKTYSSAAKKISSASSWKKLSKANINWGFTDGSAKAQQGFANALTAILRPFNNILTMLLAGDNIEVGNILDNLVKTLEIGKSTDTVSFKDGILKINVKGKDATSTTSEIKLDLKAVINEVKDLNLYGSNAYESAIVPLLEALMCDNVKTYAQYQKDIAKGKDAVLNDILTPLLAFVGDVLDAPFDTISAVLPNLANYINGNGISQLLNNLLSPITSLLPVLKHNGLDLDAIIKALLGKSLNSFVTDLLGVNINLKLSDLNACKIQNAIVPIVNMVLKSLKVNIKLPKIDWATLASHGTLKTVKSAAKNSNGKYLTQQVTAKQGETLVAVLRYVANLLTSNTKGLKTILGGIDKISKDVMSIINVVLNQLSTASSDEIIQAIFYFLKEEPTNAFWNYTNYTTKEYDFSYPDSVDVDFLKQLPPMVDGLISGLIPLNEKIGELLFKDDLINKLIGLYGKIDTVKINDNMNLTELLAQTGIDFSTKAVAKLLNDSEYGKTYSSNASIIGSASSWSKVNTDNLKWGVKDRESFFNALCAVLRPVYGVLDVLVNDASLGLFNIVYIPGSNGYTSTIVHLLEAFGVYNIKTQYQYREDISKNYDSILLDIINPLWDKVEDILSAPLQTLTSMLSNLALFIANDGLIQLLENLLVPVSALLDAVKPIVDVNDVLDAVFKMLNVDLDKSLSKIGLNLDLNIDLYNLPKMLEPIIGSDNIVSLLNQVLGLIKIKGTPLGIELMPIDWNQLASHGTFVKDASQVATFGTRVYVEGDSSETLVAVLRYLVNTINYKDNYNVISSLIGSLLGGNVSDNISGVIDNVLGMLKGDTDQVIADLCELLQTFA